MKPWLTAAALLTLAACADPTGTPRTFANNDLELAVGNGALMGCSCRFVMQMSEPYCREWVKATPDVARLTFDLAAKTVEASAFVSFAARARFVSSRVGCVLE
jgi:hypothetical protein